MQRRDHFHILKVLAKWKKIYHSAKLVMFVIYFKQNSISFIISHQAFVCYINLSCGISVLFHHHTLCWKLLCKDQRLAGFNCFKSIFNCGGHSWIASDLVFALRLAFLFLLRVELVMDMGWEVSGQLWFNKEALPCSSVSPNNKSWSHVHLAPWCSLFVCQ